jgi:hypothetical protein
MTIASGQTIRPAGNRPSANRPATPVDKPAAERGPEDQRLDFNPFCNIVQREGVCLKFRRAF